MKARSKPKRKLTSTKAYRESRTAKCVRYILEAGNIPDARRLAEKRERFTANTSAWLTALSRIVEDPKLLAELRGKGAD